MTREQYKALIHELNRAQRFSLNYGSHSNVYAVFCLRRARQMLLEMGRPS